mmetsp:Transcript_107524/g.302654  ORF Transcript_107524/g.302654 Transcript_107524/m.302654 type:complete len:417 (+) Transcript_107524:78-1328(+)
MAVAWNITLEPSSCADLVPFGRSSSSTAPPPRAKPRSSAPCGARTYYIEQDVEVVKDDLNARGWKEVPSEFSEPRLCWHVRCRHVDFRRIRRLQGRALVNFLDWSANERERCTTKVGFLMNVRRQCKNWPSWYPLTYRLPGDFSRTRAALCSDDDEGEALKGVWIYKPAVSSRGEGIKMIHTVGDLQGISRSQGILQRYINPPLLVGGRKFDLRVYVLVARCAPTALVYTCGGYARVSLCPYDVSSEDPSCHITNVGIQQQSERYVDMKDDAIWTIPELESNLLATGGEDALAGFKDACGPQVRQIVREALTLVLCSVNRKTLGTFQILGLDVMIDAEYRAHLLEINSGPSLKVPTPAHAKVLPAIVHSALELVFAAAPEVAEVADVARLAGPDAPPLVATPWELVWDEAAEQALK